ncbi:hypothetical protein KLEP7_gp171 [Pseudaeromonas phage vB_PpeM_ KLEP7]|nr:hypothetical protein KLEP7_gp171 [Pseudaeromonas phage vB_PpeM_ KLEP7]
MGSVATISNRVGNINIRVGWRYYASLKVWCEQDFQNILTPTQNELVLFELKHGFEFPFQEKNSKHPVMISIYPKVITE